MKRGASGLSLIVGIDKPEGLTSHDVVSRCRRVFGEKRVGHTGTLDPLATGALAICIGPATRLDAYLVDHDKRYRVRIAFGVGTDTDDATGDVTATGDVPAQVRDEAFARRFLESIVGPSKQMPPVFSAIKVGGKKACDEARAGRIIDLAPRDIEVYDARLFSLSDDLSGEPYGPTRAASVAWDVDLHVSKGTYIRSIARDVGRAIGCPAHVAALRRLSVGALSIDDCVPLDALEDVGVRAAIDPVRLLGVRMAFLEGDDAVRAANGNAFRADELVPYGQRYASLRDRLCACTSGVCVSTESPQDGETIAIVVDNKLAALYGFTASTGRFVPRCVFQKGVSRGECL